MKLYRRKKNGKTLPYWYADLREEGFWQRSTRLTDKELARTYVYQWLASQGPQKRKSTSPVTLFRLINEYLHDTKADKAPGSIERDEYVFKYLKEHFGDIQIKKIDPRDLTQLRVKRIDGGRKASTVTREFNSIRALFTMAVDWGYLSVSPYPKKRRARRGSIIKTIPKSYTMDQIHALLDASVGWKGAGDYWKNVWLIFLNTLLRRSEVLRIEQTNVLPSHDLFVGKTKQGQEVKIPITDELWEAFRALPWHNNKAVSHSKSYVTRTFKAIATKAGIGGNLHRLKHTSVYYLLENKVPINIVKRIAHHAGINTTMLYAEARDEDVRQAMKTLRFQKPVTPVSPEESQELELIGLS